MLIYFMFNLGQKNQCINGKEIKYRCKSYKQYIIITNIRWFSGTPDKEVISDEVD